VGGASRFLAGIFVITVSTAAAARTMTTFATFRRSHSRPADRGPDPVGILPALSATQTADLLSDDCLLIGRTHLSLGRARDRLT
jgi:hypothetical protein